MTVSSSPLAIRIAAATALAGLVACTATLAAQAAPTSANVPLQVSVTDTGSLSLTVAYNPATGPVKLVESGSSPAIRQFVANVPTVTVSDTRWDVPEDTTWAVVGQAADFQAGSRVIEAGYLGWTPSLVGEPAGNTDDDVTAGEPVVSAADDTTSPGLTGQELLLVNNTSAAAAAEVSTTWSATAALALRVPADEAAPGTYDSVLTLSLFESD